MAKSTDSTDGMDDAIKDAKDAFELCVEHEADNRAVALDDIRFARLEEQWDPRDRKKRELGGRPCLTFNKLKAFREQVVNNARQNRPSIKVHPADDVADPQVAEIYNGLIRNIENISNADVAYDTAFEAAVDGGWGYFRINTRYASDDGFDLDLVIEDVANQFSVWGDPYSTAYDSAEWNLSFVTDMMKKDAFQKRWKGADTANWDSSGYGSLTAPWCDGDDVMVAEYWTRDPVLSTILALSNGEIVSADVFEKQRALFAAANVSVIANRQVPAHKVTQRILSGCEVLETNAWAGKYIPIVPVYGDVVNLEGRRYLRSFIHSAKDGQRDFNYQRTTFIEKVALAPKTPYIGPKGAFKTDADKWATANTENHGYIEYDIVAGGSPPQRQDMSQVAAGEMQAMLQASDDLKAILGLNDASMGAQDPQEASGRAILARQRQGDVSTFHFTDNLNRAIRHAGRILIDLIPKVYTGARIVRTMGPDGVPSIVPVNQPVVQQPTPQGQPPRYVPAPQGQQAPPAQPPQGMPPQPGAPPQQPPPAPLPPMMFDLSAGKYDLVVESGPSFGTKREEAANQMIALAQADPAILPLIGDILVKNLDWPGADEIVQRIQDQRQSAQQGAPDPKAQAEAAAAMAKIKAETDAKQQQMAQDAELQKQKAAQDHELAMAQAQNEAAIEKYKADQQIATQRTLNEQTIQLKREQAVAELQLARESAQQSFEIEMAETRARADRTVEPQTWSVGGGIG